MKHVASAIEDGSWAMDVGPDLGEQALREFLSLWLCVHTWEPEVDVPDMIAWSWETNGRYSVRSAYAARFWGREVAPMAELT